MWWVGNSSTTHHPKKKPCGKCQQEAIMIQCHSPISNLSCYAIDINESMTLKISDSEVQFCMEKNRSNALQYHNF